jgi:hypothetical protein
VVNQKVVLIVGTAFFIKKLYHVNKSGQAGVFGVRLHAKNTLSAND